MASRLHDAKAERDKARNRELSFDDYLGLLPAAPIIDELVGKLLPQSRGREAEALRGLTAVDGSVFSGL